MIYDENEYHLVPGKSIDNCQDLNKIKDMTMEIAKELDIPASHIWCYATLNWNEDAAEFNSCFDFWVNKNVLTAAYGDKGKNKLMEDDE